MKYIVNIIAICILAIVIYGLVQFKETGSYIFLRSKVNKTLNFAKEKATNVKQNIAMDISGERKKPVLLVDKETYLINLSPKTFVNFGPRDWDKFWDVIYDPIREGGVFGAKRYRTKEEIKSYLINNFSSDFSRLRRRDWEILWKIVFEE